MVQRKQTVFLLFALVLTIGCLCMEIGSFEPSGMGTSTAMYNLWLSADGKHDYSVAALFVVLLVSCPLNVKAILSFNDRMYQSHLCLYNIVLIALWYAILAISVWFIGKGGATFQPSIASCLPLISLILYVMARKAILADEKLVRDADRIR